jgi:uncharacterized membrane protein
MSPEERRKQRNWWLWAFFAVSFGGCFIVFLTVVNDVSQGYRAPEYGGWLTAVSCLSSACAIVALYNWAKYKGQGGGWAILGILNLLGIIIGAIALSQLPVKDETEKKVIKPAPQASPPETGSRTYVARSTHPDKEEADDFEERAATLEKYAALKEKGLITEEEYNQQKKKILGL